MTRTWLRRVVLGTALFALVGSLGLAGWGLTLAVKGAWARIIPRQPLPRLVDHAYVVREEGSGRYLLYTEIEVHPGDVLITPDNRHWRIERVGFDTAWARPLTRPAGDQERPPADEGPVAGPAP